MPQLPLASLHCRKTEDWTGADEAYLVVKGKRRWGPQLMNDGDTVDFVGTRPVSFQSKARIDLYYEDTGWLAADDHLGRTYARAAHEGKAISSTASLVTVPTTCSRSKLRLTLSDPRRLQKTA